MGGHQQTFELLEAITGREFELPAGCSVEYTLEAIQLLEALVQERRPGATDVLRDLCLQLADEEGLRPSALQVALAGGNIRAARRRAGGWFELLEQLDLLTESERDVLPVGGAFLTEVATTAMTKSFKMVLLQALLHDGRLRSGAALSELAARSLHLIQADPRLAADVDKNEFPSVQIVETAKWERYWRRNPVDAWSGGPWFDVEGERFVPRFSIPEPLAEAFDAMVAELVEWRLHEYFLRGADSTPTGDEAILRVSHSGGTPILRLDRQKAPFLPAGPTRFVADGETYIGNFVKVALNTATADDAEGNALPALLRRWFGPAAGHPGSMHRVALRHDTNGWTLRPAEASRVDSEVTGLPFFPSYAVACGAFNAPLPADVAPRRLHISGPDVDPDDFLLVVRGESMSGGPDPLHNGDLVRMRWTKRRSVDELVGRRVLVELREHGQRSSVLKLLERVNDQFVLRSTAEGFDDIAGTHAMTVVGELVGKVDPAAWDPIGRWVGQDFRRDAVPALLGLGYNPGNWQSGHVSLPDDTILFVTLEKEAGRTGEDYVDRFDSAEVFHWTSQASTSPDGKKGRELIESLDTGRRVHLFVRRLRQDVAFTYCGLVSLQRHEGSKPMTVWFRLLTPLGSDLQRRFLR